MATASFLFFSQNNELITWFCKHWTELKIKNFYGENLRKGFQHVEPGGNVSSVSSSTINCSQTLWFSENWVSVAWPVAPPWQLYDCLHYLLCTVVRLFLYGVSTGRLYPFSIPPKCPSRWEDACGSKGPCLHSPRNGCSQPKSLRLGGGTCLGLGSDLHSTDIVTGHQRPHLSQNFWQYGCTVHSCTSTAHSRNDGCYWELQSWGENNFNFESQSWFTSCLKPCKQPRAFLRGVMAERHW